MTRMWIEEEDWRTLVAAMQGLGVPEAHLRREYAPRAIRATRPCIAVVGGLSEYTNFLYYVALALNRYQPGYEALRVTMAILAGETRHQPHGGHTIYYLPNWGIGGPE